MSTLKSIKLGELCSMSAGGTPSRVIPEYYGGEIPWAKISDIEASKDGLISETEEKITEDGLRSIRNRIFPANTLLLALYGSVGKVAITTRSISTNQAILGIRPKEENVIDLKFLKYWFDTIRESLLNRAVGGTLQNISLGIVKDLDIRLPTLEAQQKIVAILDKADALRQKDKQLLAKYDELAQAVFYNMFGDPVRNEKGWEMKKLEKVSEKIQIGPFGSQLHEEDYITGGVPLVNPKHIVGSKIVIDEEKTLSIQKFDSLPNYHLKKNDLIMGRRGEMGRCAIITEREDGWFCGTGSLFIRPTQAVSANYLLPLLTSEAYVDKLEKEAKGITMANLNRTIIENLEIPVPPLELQTKFAVIIDKIERQIQQAQLQLQKNEELFQSLLQKAFNGELIK